jgi:hypothetical protein
MERLVITSGAKEVWKEVNSHPSLSKEQKRVLTSIIQNEGVELTEKDIEQFGEDIDKLRAEDLTEKQLKTLDSYIDFVLNYLESCVTEDDLPF